MGGGYFNRMMSDMHVVPCMAINVHTKSCMTAFSFSFPIIYCVVL